MHEDKEFLLNFLRHKSLGEICVFDIEQSVHLQVPHTHMYEDEDEGMSERVGAHSSVLDRNGRVLLFGGWHEDEEETIDEAYCIDLPTRTSRRSYVDYSLTERKPLGIQHPLCYSAATSLINGDVVLTGGGDSPYQNAEVYRHCYKSTASQVELFDFDHWRDEDDDDEPIAWTDLPPLLEERCGHECITLFDDTVVVLGGYRGGTDYLSSAERLDMHTQQWISIPSMHDMRSGSGAAVGPCGGVYVAGGSYNGHNCHTSFERLDLRMKCWERLPAMSHPRGWTAACWGRQGRFFVSGGLDNSAMGTISNSIEGYDYRANKWEVLQVALTKAVFEDVRVGGGLSWKDVDTRRQANVVYTPEFPYKATSDCFARSCHRMTFFL